MRCLARLLVLVIAACGGDDASNRPGGDAGTDGGGGGGGGGGIDAAVCVGQSMVLGDGTNTTCAFAVGLSFDPSQVNIAYETVSTRGVLCHTLYEKGCLGEGWYWVPGTHEVGLCDATCDAFTTGGAGVQLILETGCPTDLCGSGNCTQSTGVCSYATASSCCSGRCDGDSCGSGLWGPCPGMFGCFEGVCNNGYCRCPPGDIQCGASCFDQMTSNQHCGTCGNACTGGKQCTNGGCTCPAGTSDCNGTCVTLATDEAHCGMCDRACRTDQSCSSSSCVCPSGFNDCNGACVPVTNPMHCGACNNACDAATEVCTATGTTAYCACAAGLFDCGTNGTCEDRMTDENNCGTCGRICPGNKQCLMGDC